MIDAYLFEDRGQDRQYLLAEPLTTRRVAHVEESGAPVWSDDTVVVTDVTVSIPQQWPHAVTIPAVQVTGTGPEVVENIGTYSSAVSWEQALSDLGLRLVDGDPPAPPQPFLVGAVPTAADLPANPTPLAVYLVREDDEARCQRTAGDDWQAVPWASCESFFGLPADQVPNVEENPS